MSATINNQSGEGNTLPPLKLTCTSSRCKTGLHCFLQKKKLISPSLWEESPGGRGGRCRSCGTDLVEWKRVYQRDLADIAYTFAALKKELIRHHFWHVELDQKAINHALRKGRGALRLAAEKRLRQSVGSAKPYRDGYQTPKEGNTLFYAQHATATCCRRCIEEWHGIPPGIPLSDEQIAYFTELLMLFVNERVPLLEDEGRKQPRVSTRKTNSIKQRKPAPPAQDKPLWQH